LCVAVLLGGALIYTSFDAATEARKPSELIGNAKPGKSYELSGKVVNGSVRRGDDVLMFDVRDRGGSASVPVRYRGAVPDPFREGREVIVTGSLRRGVFVAKRDSLVTKCPSKFTKEKSS
jgi:cytochrome c-type biogenesis protein CcmE